MISISPQVEPLENDWDNLYVRVSNLLNERGVNELYVDGSVDNPEDSDIDIMISRWSSGEITIRDGQGEDSKHIYSSHISMGDSVYPAPSFNHDIGQDRVERLNAILAGEVNVDAPSDWDLYLDRGSYGVYKPQETGLNLSFNESLCLGYTSLSMQHNGLKTEVLIKAIGSEGTTFPLLDAGGQVVEDLVTDSRFNELVQASFRAGDFEYEYYPEFNAFPMGAEWSDRVDAHLQALGNGYGHPDLPGKVIDLLGKGYTESYEKIVGDFVQGAEPAEPTLYDYAIQFMGLGAAINNEAEKTLPAKGDRREVTVIQTQDQILIRQKTEKGRARAFDTLYQSHPSKGFYEVDHELTDEQKADLVLAMQGGQDKGLSLDRQEQAQEQPSVEALEQSYSAPDATYLNQGMELLSNAQEILQENQQPNTDLYQSLYRAADQYGDFDAGFTELVLSNGYSATTTDHSLNVFRDNERIIHVVAENPGPFDGVLQEPLHIEDRSTPEQRDELRVELHNIEQWAERDFEKPHQETPIAEGAITSELPENITQQTQALDDTQLTKTPSVPIIKSTQNVFWITHKYSYLTSKLTCVKTTRTYAQARLDAYYILSEGYGASGENRQLSDVEPMQESVCHLLVKFFGYEICEYDDSAIEIDLYYLWERAHNGLCPTNKSWELWLNLSRFRWGFYPELMRIMDGSLNVDRLPQYPWHSQHRSVTGWDCGEYIIEVPFCSFNSEAEAEEFGRSCYALRTNENHPSLFRLFYGDGDQACLRKDKVTVYRKPSDSSEVNPDDHASWELTDLSAEDIPDLEISGPLYCQGREINEGVNHAN